MKTKLIILTMFLLSGICSAQLVVDPGADVRVLWHPVTLNVDGTPCTDLAGYLVYANGKATDTKDTSKAYYGITDTTAFYVRAYDASPNVNVSEASETIWVYVKGTVPPDTIIIPPDKMVPMKPEIWAEVIKGDTSFIFSAKDLSQFASEGGTLSNDARLGLYGEMTIRVPVTVGVSGVYDFKINCSGKSGLPILKINDISVATVGLSQVGSIYRTDIILQKGSQDIVLSVVNGDMWLWGDEALKFIKR